MQEETGTHLTIIMMEITLEMEMIVAGVEMRSGLGRAGTWGRA